MTIGQGIAIGCVWLAVGIVGRRDVDAAIVLGVIALITTVVIATQ